MNLNANHEADTVVVGGGVAGVAAAYYLNKKNIPFVLLESSFRTGGVIHSEHVDDLVLDWGPNTLTATPAINELIEELQMEREYLKPAPAATKRYLCRNNHLHEASPKLSAIIGSKYISANAKWKLLTERWRKKNPYNIPESVAEFVSRRFGKEVLDYIFDPVLSGIYAGDVKQLSVEMALPQLVYWERKYGSVTRGLRKQRKAMMQRKTISFYGGIEHLIEKMYATIKDKTRLLANVQSISFEDNNYVVRYTVRNTNCTVKSKRVICAVPAYAAAALLKNSNAGVAADLEKILYPPLWSLQVAFKKEDIAKMPVDGFGFLIPSSENIPFLGVIFRSLIFPSFAPEDKMLFTVFIGGALHADLLQTTDAAVLTENVIQSLQKILAIKNAPVFQQLKQWPHAIPQFNVDHKNIISSLHAFEQQHPGFFFAGNYISGVSVGEVIKYSKELMNKFFVAEKQ